jgi:hypothetical protein
MPLLCYAEVYSQVSALFFYRPVLELSAFCIGVLGACELFDRLARDRLIPQLFTRRLPITNAAAYSICAFTTISFALYAITGASIVIVSKM